MIIVTDPAPADIEQFAKDLVSNNTIEDLLDLAQKILTTATTEAEKTVFVQHAHWVVDTIGISMLMALDIEGAAMAAGLVDKMAQALEQAGVTTLRKATD